MRLAFGALIAAQLGLLAAMAALASLTTWPNPLFWIVMVSLFAALDVGLALQSRARRSPRE